MGPFLYVDNSGLFEALEGPLLTECIGRSDAKTDYDSVTNLQDECGEFAEESVEAY